MQYQQKVGLFPDKVDTTAANPSCVKFSSNEKTAVVFSGSQIAARYLARRAPELGTYNINVTGLTLATVTWDFSKNIMNFYFNGKKYHSSASGSATDRNGITLGWRLTGAAQTAVSFFAAVRYYNKALTDEEVVNNFIYDKRRYNIT